MRASIAYLWSLWFGRLAITCVAIGAIGLVTHYWMPILTMYAIPNLRRVFREDWQNAAAPDRDQAIRS